MMDAEASSSSFTQEHTFLDPTSPNLESTIAQPQLNAGRLEVETPIALLVIKPEQIEPSLPAESENTAWNDKLAKKDKQLKAARQELSRVKGEKTKLRQEVVSARCN